MACLISLIVDAKLYHVVQLPALASTQNLLSYISVETQKEIGHSIKKYSIVIHENGLYEY